MKYVILIYSNPESRAIWNETPAADRAVGLRAYAQLNAELKASGELVAGEALADRTRSFRVTAGRGRPVRTDGPFAETKEYLAGVYLVDCAGDERVAEIAGRIPEAAFGLVEVRPVTGLDDFLTAGADGPN